MEGLGVFHFLKRDGYMIWQIFRFCGLKVMKFVFLMTLTVLRINKVIS